MSAKIIDGKAVALDIKNGLKSRIHDFLERGERAPCLAVVLVGNDPASEVYVGHKKRACAAIGIESISVELPEETTQDELSLHLKKLNENDNVDGILLQLPLPKHLMADKAIDLIDPAKDVDGLTPVNQGLLVWRRPVLIVYTSGSHETSGIYRCESDRSACRGYGTKCIGRSADGNAAI